MGLIDCSPIIEAPVCFGLNSDSLPRSPQLPLLLEKRPFSTCCGMSERCQKQKITSLSYAPERLFRQSSLAHAFDEVISCAIVAVGLEHQHARRGASRRRRASSRGCRSRNAIITATTRAGAPRPSPATRSSREFVSPPQNLRPLTREWAGRLGRGASQKTSAAVIPAAAKGRNPKFKLTPEAPPRSAL